MINVRQEIDQVISTDNFKKGNKYFWLYNYSFFRFLEIEEFEERNKKSIIEGKLIFAAGTTNPDDDAFLLLFDKECNSNIYILSNYTSSNTRGAKKIADSLAQLFSDNNLSDLLVQKGDQPLLDWYYSLYESYSFEKVVPKGVLPLVDLRYYFKNQLKNTLLINNNDIKESECLKYFEDNDIRKLVPAGFFQNRFLSDEHFFELINNINFQLGEKTFFAMNHSMSSFFGIGSYKSLTKDEIEITDNYGLILPMT